MKINNFEDLMNFIKDCDSSYTLFSEIHKNGEKYINMCNNKNIIDFVNIITENISAQLLFPWFYTMVCEKFGFELIFPMTQKIDLDNRFYIFYALCCQLNIGESQLENFIDGLIANNEFNYICDNMEQIILSKDIIYLTKNEILKKLQQSAPKKFHEMHSLIVTRLFYPENKDVDNRTINALTQIVEEISENEKADISELEEIGHGTFSTAYRLGNKVIKFGKTRETYHIPYHRRIIQPLIRRKISSDYSDIYLEISEYLEPDGSITNEDVYSIYKELRDDGIIWADPKIENLGRLQKENIIHYNEPLYVADSSLGFDTPRQNEVPLQKGEIVIIDTDLLYPANTFDINSSDINYGIDFPEYEKRYQNELKAISHSNEISSEKDSER